MWPGMWRDRSSEAPSRAIAAYEQLSTAVLQYVQYLNVFVAPLANEPRLRKYIEGAISRHLRSSPDQASRFYPADNRTVAGRIPMGIRLAVSSDEPIAGLPSELNV